MRNRTRLIVACLAAFAVSTTASDPAFCLTLNQVDPIATQIQAWGRTQPKNNMTAGQCTWGAMEKFKAHTGVYPLINGNAKDWGTSADQNGWSVKEQPAKNTIIVFQPGVLWANATYGHVAWVTDVRKVATAPGINRWNIDIIEMNGNAGPGKWSTRTVTHDVVPGAKKVVFIYPSAK